MPVLQEVMHFVRWRVIALRYAGKIRAMLTQGPFAAPPPRSARAQRILEDGYDVGPKLSPQQLEQMIAIYRPRTSEVETQERGHPFVNLFRAEDIVPQNPVLRVAFSTDVLDMADDFFAGRLVLDSIQVLYSWPTQGTPRESQMWHKDYGDSKSFHWIAYLNDVRGPEDGPFAFVAKEDTRRISKSPFIRRIADQTLARELGDGRVRQFLAEAGESIFVDPANCYHSGSRCKNARLAIFVTFNTDRPFVPPIPMVRKNRELIAEVAKRLRPDLNALYLKRLLQIQ